MKLSFFSLVGLAVFILGCEGSLGGRGTLVSSEPEPKDNSRPNEDGESTGQIAQLGESDSEQQVHGEDVLEGMSMSFPPGSLAVATTLHFGRDASGSVYEALDRLEISGSPLSLPLAVSATSATDPAKPFTVSLVLPGAGLSLTGSSIAIAYRKIVHAEQVTVDGVLTKEFSISNGKISFETAHYGTFVAFEISSGEVTSREIRVEGIKKIKIDLPKLSASSVAAVQQEKKRYDQIAKKRSDGSKSPVPPVQLPQPTPAPLPNVPPSPVPANPGGEADGDSEEHHGDTDAIREILFVGIPRYTNVAISTLAWEADAAVDSYRAVIVTGYDCSPAEEMPPLTVTRSASVASVAFSEPMVEDLDYTLCVSGHAENFELVARGATSISLDETPPVVTANAVNAEAWNTYPRKFAAGSHLSVTVFDNEYSQLYMSSSMHSQSECEYAAVHTLSPVGAGTIQIPVDYAVGVFNSTVRMCVLAKDRASNITRKFLSFDVTRLESLTSTVEVAGGAMFSVDGQIILTPASAAAASLSAYRLNTETGNFYPYGMPYPDVFQGGLSGVSYTWTGSHLALLGATDTVVVGRVYAGVFNPRTVTWYSESSLASLSASDAMRRGHTSVWGGGKLHVVGGSFAGASPGSYLRATISDSSNFSSFPLGDIRKNHASEYAGNSLVVWGGRVDSLDGAMENLTNEGFRLTSGGVTPESMSAAPLFAREGHSAVSGNGEIYFWGGTGYSGPLNDGAIYRVSDDSWRVISTENAPSARSKHKAVWTGSRMIVVGGIEANGHPVDSGGIYDPSTDSWEMIPSGILGKRINPQVMYHDGRLFVFGGVDETSTFVSGGVVLHLGQ